MNRNNNGQAASVGAKLSCVRLPKTRLHRTRSGVVQSGANKKIPPKKSRKLKLKVQLPDAVQLLTVNRVEAVTQIRGKHL